MFVSSLNVNWAFKFALLTIEVVENSESSYVLFEKENYTLDMDHIFLIIIPRKPKIADVLTF